ncbi:MAG: hypothetical protein RJA63_1896 [Pseudomonadota bacterium]|jgi:TPR repeat protein
MYLIKTLLKNALFASVGLLALVSASASLAQSQPSAERAPPSLESRLESMEKHYSSGRNMSAMVVGKRMCVQEGVVRACFIAGEILEKGLGVAANLQEAAKLYNRACMEKDKSMCLRAADIYMALVAKEPVPEGVFPEDWIGVSQSDAAYGAKVAYQSACELREAKACDVVGGIYLAGHMAKQALQAYNKGCELGHADSCYGYASVMHYGVQGPSGMPSDPMSAKPYFRKACDLGHKESCGKAK